MNSTVPELHVERIDPNAPAPALISRAVSELDRGGVVVAPTETRYGLLARADRSIPAERLRQIKQREAAKPIAVFVGSIEMIMHYGVLNPAAQRLARLFLPGPLTLVLQAVGTWDRMVVPEGKIGIRVSSSPVIQAIMELVDYPVTATSANVAGTDDNTRIDRISASLGDQVELYLDAGPLEAAASTVVDCSAGEPVILREGAVTVDEVAAGVLGRQAINHD